MYDDEVGMDLGKLLSNFNNYDDDLLTTHLAIVSVDEAKPDIGIDEKYFATWTSDTTFDVAVFVP